MSENTGMILDALIAQVTPNVSTNVLDEGLTDTKDRLTFALKTKMGDNPDAWAMMERYVEDPANWYGVASDALQQANAADDPEVVAAAREILALTEPLAPKGDPQDQLSEREVSDMVMGQAPHFEEYLDKPEA